MAINIGNMVPLFTPKHTGSADSMERRINSGRRRSRSRSSAKSRIQSRASKISSTRV